MQNQMINPIVTRYFVSLNIAVSFSAYIFGFFAVGSVLTRPLSGKILAKIDSKKVIFYSSILMCICGFLYSFVTNYIFVLVVRFIHGAMFAFCTTALMSTVSFFIPKEKISFGMGLFGLGQVISVALGPFIALFIAETNGYQKIFITASVLSLLSGLLCFFLKDIQKYEHKGKFFHKEILGIGLLAMLLFFVNGIDVAYILLVAKNLGIKRTWLYFILSAVLMLFARFFFSGISDKKGLKFALVPSFSLLALSSFCLIVSLWQNVKILFFVSGLLKGFAHAFAQTALQSESIKKASESTRANMSACFYMFCDLGMILAPFVSSFFGENFILIYALSAFLSVFSVFFSIKRAR